MENKSSTFGTNLPVINHVEGEKPKKVKKRKAPEEDDEETKQLRHKAKFYCKDKESWRVVSKYSKKKLEDFLQDQTYIDASQLIQDTSHFAMQAYAWSLDKLTRGEGFVDEEIRSDASLQKAIERELVYFAQFITNRMQVVMFSMSDVFNAHKKKKADGESKGAHMEQLDNGGNWAPLQEIRPTPEPETGPTNSFAPGQEAENRTEEEVQWPD